MPVYSTCVNKRCPVITTDDCIINSNNLRKKDEESISHYHINHDELASLKPGDIAAINALNGVVVIDLNRVLGPDVVNEHSSADYGAVALRKAAFETQSAESYTSSSLTTIFKVQQVLYAINITCSARPDYLATATFTAWEGNKELNIS